MVSKLQVISLDREFLLIDWESLYIFQRTLMILKTSTINGWSSDIADEYFAQFSMLFPNLSSKISSEVPMQASDQKSTGIFKRSFIGVAILLLFAILIFVLFRASEVRFHAKVVRCKGYFFQLGCFVNDYYRYYYDKYPSYPSSPLQEHGLWSWRSVMLEPNITPEIKIKREEPWNSAYNMEHLEEYQNDHHFTCPCDYPHEKKASYVAVTGPGTIWTETNVGRLKNPHENCPNHIIIIETSEPKNHWAEPGDDVSPDDVVRLFLADPGLKRNSRQSIFTRGHWPKHFVRADGSVGDFGQIKDVDELRKLLVVPEDNLKQK